MVETCSIVYTKSVPINTAYFFLSERKFVNVINKSKHKKAERSRLYLARRVVFCLLLILLLIFLIRHLFSPAHPTSFPFRIFGENKLIFFKQNEIQVSEDMNRCKWDASLFRMRDGFMHYDDPQTEYATGIDVSSYQKTIDWETVKSSGIEFAVLRLGYRGTTEGGLFQDSYFEDNYQGAVNVGLPVGVYFFSQALTPEEAVEEADYLLSVLNGRELQLPVVFDWEYVSDTARTANIDSAVLSSCAEAFCSTVEKSGYKSMVYFNLYTSYLIYDMDSFGQQSIWLAQFADQPTYYYHYEMWQYSCTGTVSGIETEVDLNIVLDSDLVRTIKQFHS